MGSRVSGSLRPVHTAIAISPDGRRVVFAGTLKGAPQLLSRDIDRAEATSMPGTEGGDAPFFSPDGAWVGFWARNTLKKVPAGGGPAATISDVPPGLGWGASWGEDDTIFFARDAGIFKVSASGGAPVAVTTSNDERHLLPHALPGANAILYTRTTVEEQSGRRWDKASIVLHPLGGGEQRVLIPGGVDARYVSTGHLVYMKSGTLMAVPFDAGSQQVTGAPIALIEGVMQSVNTPNTDDETGAGQFVVSNSGTLLYATGGISPVLTGKLVWVDRKGAVTPLANALEGSYSNARISPDGQKIAVAAKGAVGENRELWVYDVARGAPTRLTFEGASAPTWSPDGRRILFNTDTLYTIRADGSGKPEALAVGGERAVAVFLVGRQCGCLRAENAEWRQWHLGSSDGGRREAAVVPRIALRDLASRSFARRAAGWRTCRSNLERPKCMCRRIRIPGRRFASRRLRDSIHSGRRVAASSCSDQYRVVRLETSTCCLQPSARSRRFAPTRLGCCSSRSSVNTTALRQSEAGTSALTASGCCMLQRVASTDKPVTALHIVLNWAQELERLVQPK